MVDKMLLYSFGGVLVLLVAGSMVSRIVSARVRSVRGRTTATNLRARMHAWWIMAALFAASLFTGVVGTVILFGIISFLALREFVTRTPTDPDDHGALFWSCFVITPLQYWLVADPWYGLYSILIPVYAFLFIPLRLALKGRATQFLVRASTIQWGLMLCVYCISHAPALLMLEIPGYEGKNARLLFFVVVVTQLSDVLQYVFGKLFGKHPVAPKLSPNKTWEGFAGGVLAATGVGAALGFLTPFALWQTALLALLITLMGFAGGLVWSAVKRDRGVKDYGSLLAGHGGMMDRMDSLCFAAPIFFHIVRYYFTE